VATRRLERGYRYEDKLVWMFAASRRLHAQCLHLAIHRLPSMMQAVFSDVASVPDSAHFHMSVTLDFC